MSVNYNLYLIVTIDKDQVKRQRKKIYFCAPNLFLNEEYSDVKVKCEGKIFPCHKNILSIRSKYFEACLSHQGTTESESGVIEISDHPSKVV